MKFNTENVDNKIISLFHELLGHNGFGDLKVEVKILKRGQKEVILHCGKQYRFVVDVPWICNTCNKSNCEEHGQQE